MPPPGRRELPDDVARHLAVVRARPGTGLRLCDGAGTEADAVLVEVRRGRALAEVGPAEQVHREPARRVELAFAAPKGTRAEWLFEHGTELGVARFRPVRFERSTGADRARRAARWQRIVDAAVEQCDRSHAPEVADEVALDALLADPTLPPLRRLALPGAPPLADADRDPRQAALWLVGPEGGITAAEVEHIVGAGFAGRGLGPLTLRVETAALIGCARLLG
ncbi:MAG: 16S rRNA (uracil(1498)-N(3))-methyltransferase [Planctomycetes bacterium]|nr:16S rRNA (uracil(1498)-N(3))-methyltransferase [Planctomycetota bacterium]